ncbi:MAG TPA: PfkB family carbohydrate kinase [Pyrinomonadaceae bacterium]|nr:PfkB family carbohydrate kinase [Pyrinomonadaceae bacterium]
MADDAETISNRFSGKRVVIVGDLVADQFLHGTISRVSREAPVFILRHDSTATIPGAAANAAANVASLGGQPLLVGIIGADPSGEKLSSAMSSRGVDCRYVVADAEFATTTKVRVLAGQHYAGRQQVIRIDYENQAGISRSVHDELRKNFAAAAAVADAIILSDYSYGAIFGDLIADAIDQSRRLKIPLIVDSRYSLRDFAGATTATPNREEVEQILGKDFTLDACRTLRESMGFTSLLVTDGNKGMTLFEADKPPYRIDAVGSPEPVDVTGAGDTVIAAYALGLAVGMDFADAATVANHAGGIVVMKKGTACVTIDELTESLDSAENRVSMCAS